MKTVYEHIQVNEHYPFKISIFNKVKFNYPFHYHPNEYEITLTLGCEGYRIIGDKFEHFGKTDLALIGPGVPHGWNTFNPKEIHSTKAKVIVIQFSNHMFAGLSEKQFFNPIRKLLLSSGKGLVVHGKSKEKAVLLISQMQERQSINEYLNIMELLALLSTSNDLLEQCSNNYSFKGNEYENETFGKVYKFILNNYTENIKLKDAANIACLSESAFSHYFKKRTLKSFSGFIIELRLAHATRLMQTSKLSITQIAYESGFNNLSNFNRLFKRHNKIRPFEQKKIIPND